MPTHADAIAQLRATPAILETLLSAVDEERASQPVDAGWGPKHVVAHLTITDRLGTIGRIRRIQGEENPLMPGVDEDAALHDSGLLAKTTRELLDGFVAARTDSVRWLEAVPPQAFERTGQHSVVGEINAEQLLFHAAYHDLNHLQQLLAMLSPAFEPLRGPMRAY